jgi:hypothetical protein
MAWIKRHFKDGVAHVRVMYFPFGNEICSRRRVNVILRLLEFYEEAYFYNRWLTLTFKGMEAWYR